MRVPVVLLLGLLLASPAFADSIVPESYVFRGSGEIRYLGLIKVYDAALYTPKTVTRERLLAAESSRCLELTYDVDLKPEDFVKAADIILKKQHDAATLAAVGGEINQLHASYRAVRDGDVYTLCYDGATRNTSLVLNREVLVSIESADFAAVYFGIWLGDKEPLSDSLRDALVNGLRRGES